MNSYNTLYIVRDSSDSIHGQSYDIFEELLTGLVEEIEDEYGSDIKINLWDSKKDKHFLYDNPVELEDFDIKMRDEVHGNCDVIVAIEEISKQIHTYNIESKRVMVIFLTDGIFNNNSSSFIKRCLVDSGLNDCYRIVVVIGDCFDADCIVELASNYESIIKKPESNGLKFLNSLIKRMMKGGF